MFNAEDFKNVKEYSLDFISPVVYFLIKDNKIVYIGKSTKPEMRFRSHYDSKKDFDSIYYIEFLKISKRKLADIEFALLRLFKPPLNRVYPYAKSNLRETDKQILKGILKKEWLEKYYEELS